MIPTKTITHVRFCHPVHGKREWTPGKSGVAYITQDNYVVLKRSDQGTREHIVPMSNVAFITSHDIPDIPESPAPAPEPATTAATEPEAVAPPAKPKKRRARKRKAAKKS